MNSKLIAYWYKKQSVTSTVKVSEIRRIPIKLLDLKNKTELEKYQKVIEATKEIASLKDDLCGLFDKMTNSRSETERKLTQKINELDSQIYSLYGLNEEQVNIVKSEIND